MFALFSFVRFCFHVLLCRPVPARTDSTHNTPISPFLLGVIGKLPIPTPTGGPVLTPDVLLDTHAQRPCDILDDRVSRYQLGEATN